MGETLGKAARHIKDAIRQPRTEKARRSAVREINIAEHSAEIAILLIGRQLALRQGAAFGDQRKIGGELARTKAGAVKTLPGRRTAIEHVCLAGVSSFAALSVSSKCASIT